MHLIKVQMYNLYPGVLKFNLQSFYHTLVLYDGKLVYMII